MGIQHSLESFSKLTGSGKKTRGRAKGTSCSKWCTREEIFRRAVVKHCSKSRIELGIPLLLKTVKFAWVSCLSTSPALHGAGAKCLPKVPSTTTNHCMVQRNVAGIGLYWYSCKWCQ